MNDTRGQFADFFGRLWREKPLGIASGIVISILILLAIFADVLAPYPFDQLSLAERLQGSSTRHLLGTDQLGRDLLSRLLFGARISLVVGLAATTLNVVVATLIGGTSGFDMALMVAAILLPIYVLELCDRRRSSTLSRKPRQISMSSLRKAGRPLTA